MKKKKLFRKKNKGQAIIVVIGALLIVGLLMISVWRKTSLLHDLTSARKMYYKNLLITDALLSFGISVVKKYFNKFVKKIDQTKCRLIFDLDFALKGIERSDKGILSADLVVDKEKDDPTSLRVRANLYENKIRQATVSCMITKKISVREDGSKDVFYDVEHYNISPGL